MDDSAHGYTEGSEFSLLKKPKTTASDSTTTTMNHHEHIVSYLSESTLVLHEIAIDHDIQYNIVMAAEIMSKALRNGNKIIACGNGGSMSDAMHFAAELTGRYKENRDPLAAIALSDPGAMSCIANDFGYGYVFRRQVVALGNIGDVLLAITTSGGSQNVVYGVSAAKQKGMTVIVLTGKNGIMKTGNSFEDCDIEIKVPSNDTNHVQEAHINIIHLLVELIEKAL